MDVGVTAWLGAIVLVAIQIIVFAVAWGDMRRRVISLEAIGKERHDENQDIMKEIRHEVKTTNGAVVEHTALLKVLEKEVDRLGRGKP